MGVGGNKENERIGYIRYSPKTIFIINSLISPIIPLANLAPFRDYVLFYLIFVRLCQIPFPPAPEICKLSSAVS